MPTGLCLYQIIIKIFQTIKKSLSAQEFGLEIYSGEITRKKSIIVLLAWYMSPSNIIKLSQIVWELWVRQANQNWKDIEDIYSFAVNTINIVIEWNENISIFTSAKHKWKFECFHYTRWKLLWYSLKKSKFSFYFIVHTSMRISDVISNITKQNMNVMTSTLSA